MAQDHVDAIVARLNSAGISVYDAFAARPEYNPADWAGAWTSTQQAQWDLSYPYAVIFAGALREVAQTLSTAVKDIDDRIPIMAVGESAWQARHLASSIFSVLDGAHPHVAGWSTWIHRVSVGSPTPHTSVALPPVAAPPVAVVDGFRYRATRED